MKRAIQTGFEGAHSLSSVDAKLEFLLAFIPVRWVTSPQPSADRPRKDGRWQTAWHASCHLVTDLMDWELLCAEAYKLASVI